MLSKTIKWLSIIIAAGFIFSAGVLADDLDDGISKHTEDEVKGYDELGSQDRNIKFIKMNAKSRAKVKGQKGLQAGQGANMNSVVMGAGSNVKGDIIIIDESKGNKTIVSE